MTATQVDRALSNERVVGPKYIPSGLPPDNTPQSVLELLAKVPEEGSGSEQGEADRCAAVAKDMARRLKYQIKVSFRILHRSRVLHWSEGLSA